MRIRVFVAALCVAAGVVGAVGGTVSGAFAAERPAIAADCAPDTSAQVADDVDFLLVHTDPDINSPAVGQVPGGSTFEYCAESETTVDGTTWVFGDGDNDGTTVEGWVDEEFLVLP